MTEKHLGIGFIGGGFITRFHIESLISVRNVDVIGVMSKTKKSAEESAALAKNIGVGNNAKAYDSITDMIADPNIDALWVCSPNFARIETFEEIANAIEEATLEVVPNITKRTPTLQSVANIATLMGLLGTIMGLIEAFDAVAKAPPDQKTAMLTASIAIAMNTTAFGLIVAIPTLIFYIFLNNHAKKILDEMDQYSVKLQNLLVSRGKGAQSPLDR